MATIPVTAQLAQDQRRAQQQAKSTQDATNHGATSIETQDQGKEPGYVIYVYNILNKEHLVSQPPIFPGVIIPACKPHEKFSFTVLPAFVKEPYFKPGTTEMYYKNVDGRKAATSLLNPSAFPGTKWESQLQKWDTGDQYGNNLNAYGVWWSLTKPDEAVKLEKEIAAFRERVHRTMDELIKKGEEFAASGDLKSITPWMHFAMDYLGKQAPWHMATHHMIACPNCGDPVKEGIAYHRNSFGERCIVNPVRYKEMLETKKRLEAQAGVEADPDATQDAELVGAAAGPTGPAPAAKTPKPRKSAAAAKD